ncbi:ABC transporter substrate-binding protein [Polymorphum gilvum]|uniref:Leucine-binding protein domain-containing protein n=1 Tax=Polymorphum gilvum (strain LMG 25793 / CGMCC 1.9160 / SL003B-26A1) TaxID=991905 RepID=F2IXX1_POLGS|nr:ABC transporter substrate-binding protein [Polymorphum gilvum]ADZ69452.1 hypothetical protein SL003B_1023 [Polymorphum gilvum SL003B-26A1]
MRLTALAGVLAVLLPCAALAKETQEIRSAVIRVGEGNRTPTSRLDLPPSDVGFAGARLATDDNQTTGRFMGQTFLTEEVPVATAEEAGAKLEELIAQGTRFIVTMADADTTLALADRAGDRALVLNAMAREDRLRNEACRANLLHTAPSHAMVADSLAQFLVWKGWRNWFLISGDHAEDLALADAYRRAARKFGAKIVEERVFEDTGGARRTDSGHVQVQKQIPAFTQRAKAHDIVVAADENDVFAVHLPYHTWDARPVAGSAGLRPLTWHPAQEAWGATQFQNRFERASNRFMREEDYQVWTALRVLGEAATRTKSGEFEVLRDHILGESFELAAFKGQKLTFRSWDGQLRQPILLTADRILVSVSPQPEFLHQVSHLDTLGHDRPESACSLKR